MAVFSCVFSIKCGPPDRSRLNRGTPNILIFLVDALRFDHLSQYGYPLATSPGLEEIASKSFKFTRAYSPASWTVPSVASLFSGLAPQRHRSIFYKASLSSQIRTLAEALRGRGYLTAGFSANLNISIKSNFAQGFDFFWDHKGKDLSYPDIDRLFREYESWRDSTETNRPLFLYFHIMNCHGPYLVPKEHQTKLFGRPPSSEFKYYGPMMKEILKHGELGLRKKVTFSLVSSLFEQYDTAIRYTTDRIAEFFNKHNQNNFLDESIIIFTSDHGEELFEHGGFSHGYSLYEEVIRIPLFIKMPAQAEGITIEAPVQLTDIFPTLLDIVGIAYDENIDGISIVPLLYHGNSEARRRLVSTLEDRRLFFQVALRKRCIARAIIVKGEKLIHIVKNYEGLTNQRLLFRLSEDYLEQNDLSSTNPGLMINLCAAIEEETRKYRLGAFPRPPNGDFKDQVDVLRSLGYIR